MFGHFSKYKIWPGSVYFSKIYRFFVLFATTLQALLPLPLKLHFIQFWLKKKFTIIQQIASESSRTNRSIICSQSNRLLLLNFINRYNCFNSPLQSITLRTLAYGSNWATKYKREMKRKEPQEVKEDERKGQQYNATV